MFNTYFDKFKTAATFRNSIIVSLFLLPILIMLFIFFSEDNDEFSQMGNTSYKNEKVQSRCEVGTRPGDEPMTIFITCLNCSKHWRQ